MIWRNDRGDTIVEVLLAFTILTLLSAGTMVIMNRGLAVSERSLERTLVRQQVDAQAELLRYARDTNSDAWDLITSDTNLVTSPSPSSASILANGCPTTAPLRSFVMIMSNPSWGSAFPDMVYRTSLNATTFEPASTHSQVDTTRSMIETRYAKGMWIQAVRVRDGTSNAPVAYDMHIRACWDSIGQEVPMQVATIVRLYEN